MKPKIFNFYEPDPAAIILGTGYNQFESHYGIGGLAKENGDRLDVLAVAAFEKRKGMFRDFINACKKEYQTICIWFVQEEWFQQVLQGYGFKPEIEIDGQGKGDKIGYRWDATASS